MNGAKLGYMNECEFIEALARLPDPNDRRAQDRMCKEFGIDLDDYSQEALEDIGERVSKAWLKYHN